MSQKGILNDCTSSNETLKYKVVRKRVTSLKPSPENLDLYRVIDQNELDNIKLAASIKTNGLHEPLVVTSDNYIVSGHRRHAALKSIGQVVAPCRVLDIRYDALSTEERIALLRDHNRQRYKNVAEQVRETLIDIDKEKAYQNLITMRDKSVLFPNYEDVTALEIEGVKRRSAISKAKAEHVKYIHQVVFTDRRKYWPISVRAVHYALLNYRFLRNTTDRLKYENDKDSYRATSDLITRMRLSGELPWEAFTDGTRPIELFHPFNDVRQYIRQEFSNLLQGYWRDLLQTQPNHVEVLCEKNTIYHMVLAVTKRFQLPTSSGRGFNSIDPWHELYVRYKRSGKRRLIVIVLSDFDPEGEMIPQVGGRTLRDDFGVKNFDIIKAGVTRQQIEEHELPAQNVAKESSSNHDWFVARNNGDDAVYELEALEPEVMLDDLETVITSTLDMDLFNLEAQAEQEESSYLEAARNSAKEALKGLME